MVVLFISDGVMCALTGVSWVIQRLVLRDILDWNRTGWVLQNVRVASLSFLALSLQPLTIPIPNSKTNTHTNTNIQHLQIWQSLFIASVVGLTLIRDWPWTHTVFFVLHGLIMLMKQHSYAFYNGYLSSVYKKRKSLLAQLKKLESMQPVKSGSGERGSTASPSVSALSTNHLDRRPSAAVYRERRNSIAQAQADEPDDIESISRAIGDGAPLDLDQVLVFERLLK